MLVGRAAVVSNFVSVVTQYNNVKAACQKQDLTWYEPIDRTTPHFHTAELLITVLPLDGRMCRERLDLFNDHRSQRLVVGVKHFYDAAVVCKENGTIHS